jgi:hypothetical protein
MACAPLAMVLIPDQAEPPVSKGTEFAPLPDVDMFIEPLVAGTFKPPVLTLMLFTPDDCVAEGSWQVKVFWPKPTRFINVSTAPPKNVRRPRSAAPSMPFMPIGTVSHRFGTPSVVEIPFSPTCQTGFASLARHDRTMRTIVVIFVLALITIAGGIYSDAVLTGDQVRPAAAPDPATVAVAHAARRLASSPFKGG